MSGGGTETKGQKVRADLVGTDARAGARHGRCAARRSLGRRARSMARQPTRVARARGCNRAPGRRAQAERDGQGGGASHSLAEDEQRQVQFGFWWTPCTPNCESAHRKEPFHCVSALSADGGLLVPGRRGAGRASLTVEADHVAPSRTCARRKWRRPPRAGLRKSQLAVLSPRGPTSIAVPSQGILSAKVPLPSSRR